MKFSTIGGLVLIALLSVPGWSQIRSTDFANFTYEWPADLIDPSKPEKHFTLLNGEVPVTRNKKGQVHNIGVGLGPIVYGDITGDGREEAIVRMGLVTGGSAMPNLVYVFTMRGGKPKMLWSRTTGDGGDGGLRSVYIQDGNLVLEVNSPDEANGDCCPTRFTRTSFKWIRNGFRIVKREGGLITASRI